MQSTAIDSFSGDRGRLTTILDNVRINAPNLIEVGLAVLSSLLLVLSFPDFDLWPLAWIGLAPLLIAVARRPQPWRAFLLGWLTGSLFFYGSCYWLTYSMIHYGGLPPWLAYVLLIPATLAAGLFPALFSLVLALSVRRWRAKALFLTPIIWVAFEWTRLLVIGQLWNAIGYSQAYQPSLIQPARWGGVYAVGFLVLTVNAGIAFFIVNRCRRAAFIVAAVMLAVALVIIGSRRPYSSEQRSKDVVAVRVVAIQPNVPMDLVKTSDEMRDLTARHLSMSEQALAKLPNDGIPRLLIWPESPMNYSYASDSQFRELVTRFTREHHTALLFNSQEPGANNGIYNSAMLIDQEGALIGQYDKIRLLPFGEYVPLPRWLPGADLISGLVGDFLPGVNYTQLPAGNARAGVFICIESAYPSIARTFAHDGAQVLINISNDGYLGRTAVMRQHLANAVFRAVENERPVARVTNSGITAFITPQGLVQEPTSGFEPAVRTWSISASASSQTFYTRFGDVFAFVCAGLTLLIFAGLIRKNRKKYFDNNLPTER